MSLSRCRGARDRRTRVMRGGEELSTVNCHDDGERGRDRGCWQAHLTHATDLTCVYV